MRTLVQDVRYAFRSLARSPGFTAVALATFALGIAANAGIFSVADAVLWRPLPYPAADRLVRFGDRSSPDEPDNVGFETFEDLRDGNRTFSRMALIRSWYPTLVGSEGGERLAAMRVTPDYFAMLGARPALGRLLEKVDDDPEHWQVVVLSDALWRQRFGADPGVVGRSVRLNGSEFRVVGVLPATFRDLPSARYYQPAQLWAPVGYRRGLPYACRSCEHLKGLGQLAPGVSIAQAAADLDRIRGRLAAQYPRDYPPGHVGVTPFWNQMTDGARAPLLILLGAVGFVLLSACANLANLMLARGVGRSGEMAIRGALGASRGRLIRQLLVESLLLGAAGGALGIGLAALSHSALVRLAPVALPRLDEAGIDLRVVAFAALLSLAAALAAGLVPAFQTSAAWLPRGLAAVSRASAGNRAARSRRGLVAADLAIGVVLVAGAFLMVRSLVRLLDAPFGFSPDRVLTLAVSLNGSRYEKNEAMVGYQRRALDRIGARADVVAAGFAGQIPLGGNGDAMGFHVEGHSKSNTAEDPAVERYSVTPGYFAAMGIPVKRGRLFTEADRADSLPVMIVSETTARTLFPGRDPIGERVRIGDPDDGPWRTIVGVAGDVRHRDVADAPTPQMYLPQAQVTDGFLTLVVRSRTAQPERLAPSLVAGLRELDPSVPVYAISTMDDLVSRSASARVFLTRLLAGFAGVALLIAAIGLYGVVAHGVAQRRREFGIRTALGARPDDIVRLVLVHGAGTVAAGLGAGLLLALSVTRLLRSVLYEVRPGDPLALAGAAALLAAVALAAHWFPARRAARLDPTAALRSD